MLVLQVPPGNSVNCMGPLQRECRGPGPAQKMLSLRSAFAEEKGRTSEGKRRRYEEDADITDRWCRRPDSLNRNLSMNLNQIHSIETFAKHERVPLRVETFRTQDAQRSRTPWTGNEVHLRPAGRAVSSGEGVARSRPDAQRAPLFLSSPGASSSSQATTAPPSRLAMSPCYADGSCSLRIAWL